jgi:hypothetical protein
MEKIERIDEKLLLFQKPPLRQIDRIKIKEEDALVLCAGFEDRCLEALKCRDFSSSANFTLIVVRYTPERVDNKLGEIEKMSKDIGIKPIVITYNRQNPTNGGEDILEHLNNVKGRIFIDVSGMSRLLIVQTIVAFGKSKRRFNNITILYTEALRYPPTQKELDETLKKNEINTIYRTMFLSFGVLEVTIVPELSSIALQGQPIRLIAFPSFNVDQLNALRKEIQPGYLNFIHGKPSLLENTWRSEAIKKLNCIEEENNLQHSDKLISTLDYRETLDYLLEVYAEFGALNRLVIAPTGSKMQSLSVGIFKTFMDDVLVAYPTPRNFPKSAKDYTEGVRCLYALDLDAFSTILMTHTYAHKSNP